MLYISFSLGVSESMKDSAEGVISVTRSSRAYRNTQQAWIRTQIKQLQPNIHHL